MKHLFLTVLVLILSISSNSQNLNFAWAKQFGGSGSDIGFSVKTDATGNVYTTGFFTGSADFDPGPGIFNLNSSGSQDIFITKLSPAGNLIWAKQIGGAGAGYSAVAYTLVLDGAGNFYITGNFEGIIDFDPGFSQFNLQTTNIGGWREIFVCKLDVDGNFIWARQFGGLGSAGLLATSLAIDMQGNVLTTGFISGVVDFDPGPAVFNLQTVSAADQSMFISKLDAGGNFIWAKQLGDGRAQCWGFAIQTDASGNVFTTGGFGGTPAAPGIVDFDPGSGVFTLTCAVSTTDVFVLKLNTSGNFQWAKQLSYGTNNMGRSMVLNATGDIYVTGYCTISNSDVFITNLTPAGNLGWTKIIGGSGYEEAHSITTDISGNIYVTGFFDGIVDFDPGSAVSNLNSAGRADVFILKVDVTGSFLWAKHSGGVDTDAGYSVDVDNQGNVFTTGSFTDVADFDPGAGSFNLAAIGGTDIFVQKLSKCLNVSSFAMTVSACKSYTLNSQVYSMSGNYTQTLINAAGCDSLITLDLTILPVAVSTISKTICNGQSFEGYASSGVYNDTFVGVNGCDSIRTLNLAVQAKKIPDLGSDRSFCKNDSIILNPGAFQSYTWQNGSTKNYFVVKQPGLYSVTVQDNCGISTDQVIVTETTCDIYFPSAFTPNNDGKNDLFKVLTNYNLKNFHLSVYDRWGERIFDSKDYTKGWDGKINGQLLDPGVFVWYCEFRKPGNSELITMKGTVSLIR